MQAAQADTAVGVIVILHIITVKPLENYRLYLTFNNGVAGEIDLTDELWEGCFCTNEGQRALPNRASG